MNKDAIKSTKAKLSPSDHIDLVEILVEELMKDNPNQKYIRKLCIDLKIPYSLNATTQMGNVFNKLQTLKAQVINK